MSIIFSAWINRFTTIESNFSDGMLISEIRGKTRRFRWRASLAMLVFMHLRRSFVLECFDARISIKLYAYWSENRLSPAFARLGPQHKPGHCYKLPVASQLP